MPFHDGHGHDRHDHGHSHRSGPATRFWKEPKPVAITLLIFLLLLVFQSLPPLRAAVSTKSKELPASLPPSIRAVLWEESPHLLDGAVPVHVHVRTLHDLDTSCTFRNRTLQNLHANELAMLQTVACVTLECVWVMDELFSQKQLLKRFLILDAKVELPFHWNQVATRKDFQSAVAILPQGLQQNDALLPSMNQADCASSLVYPSPSVVKPILSQCPKQYDFHSEVDLCVKRQVKCALLTVHSCRDNVDCALDCETWFAKEIVRETNRAQTVTISLITLFLLGAVLGLLFAKLYWVDPLLDRVEQL